MGWDGQSALTFNTLLLTIFWLADWLDAISEPPSNDSDAYTMGAGERSVVEAMRSWACSSPSISYVDNRLHNSTANEEPDCDKLSTHYKYKNDFDQK